MLNAPSTLGRLLPETAALAGAQVETVLSRLREKPAHALRACFREGYGLQSFRTDLLAGLVVGVIALPLSMALGIAVGVGPQAGIFTAIVAGTVAAVLGGSRVQVTGPTAAFVVILAPSVAEFGVAGLLVATFFAGLMLIALGLSGLGRAISFIPFPVVLGFTAGIAATIAILQLKDFLGVTLTDTPHGSLAKFAATVRALPTLSAGDLSIGTGTLLVLIALQRFSRQVPPALIAITVATIAATLLAHYAPQLQIETIASRFGTEAVPSGIAATIPTFDVPWLRLSEGLSWDAFRELMPSALAIALLGAIESLLSAVASDGMTGHRHDPDAELVGQGCGNVACSLFGGIAATGAIARTAANARAGARSPIAAVVHAAFLTVAVLSLSTILGHLPLASLSALLLFIAWNIADLGHCVRVLRTAPRGDSVVLIACFVLTVSFDMVIAVFVGVTLASILFIARMSEITGVERAEENDKAFPTLPPHTALYRVSGPMFFGAAERALAEFERVDSSAKHVFIDLSDVPAVDATALVHLEGALHQLSKRGVSATIVGVRSAPKDAIMRAMHHWRTKPSLTLSLDEALLLHSRADAHPHAPSGPRQ